MRYEVIRYPRHWEVIDHARNRASVHQSRSLAKARKIAGDLNRSYNQRLAAGERPEGCSKGCVGRVCRDALNCDAIREGK